MLSPLTQSGISAITHRGCGKFCGESPHSIVKCLCLRSFQRFEPIRSISRKFNKWFPFIKQLKEKDEYFHKSIKENIINRKFDLVILNEKYSEDSVSFISATYNIRDSININFYHTHEKIKLFVWESKP